MEENIDHQQQYFRRPKMRIPGVPEDVVIDFLVSSNTEDNTLKHTKVQLFPTWSYWFLRVSFSRVSEPITGFIHFPAWDILLPLAETPDRRDQRLLLSLPKDTGKVGRTKLPKLRNSGGGFESLRSKARRSITRPSRPTYDDEDIAAIVMDVINSNHH